jgi:hypothetical protein
MTPQEYAPLVKQAMVNHLTNTRNMTLTQAAQHLADNINHPHTQEMLKIAAAHYLHEIQPQTTNHTNREGGKTNDA